ncbi:MAG: hypothetical protein NZ874_03050 [Fimbriimonadales bacterium]|nr:hypothetical protein [Fimbriimonadales bacterium]
MIGKCFQLEIVSFLQGRLGTCPYRKYPVGARLRRAQVVVPVGATTFLSLPTA